MERKVAAMKSIKTQFTNIVYTQPYEWNDKIHGECVNLNVHQHEGFIMSWWKPSFKERIKILFGKSIKITLLTKIQPPISVLIDPDNAKPL